MKRDLRNRLEALVTRLEALVTRLEDQHFETCATEIKPELHQIALDLKYIIDFTLAPPLSDTQQLSPGFRLMYCKTCGTCCVRRDEPGVLCPAGHELSHA